MRRALTGLALSVLLLSSCGETVERHPARGIVRDVDVAEGQVVIDHEDIPGLMDAMTMSFDVADPKLLESLEPGQRVDFVIEYDRRSLRIVEIRVSGEGASRSDAPRLEALAAERTPAPAFALTDQDGAVRSLDSLRGKHVLVDFVYTRCSGPCPILTASHVSLQRMLSSELRQKTWFVSISIDPERDTPEALRRYAKERGADLARWSFLTGPREEVEGVVRDFGVGATRRPDGEFDHLVVTFLLDAHGRIARRYIGLEHEPEEILDDLERLTAG